jgi:hypothetical protein
MRYFLIILFPYFLYSQTTVNVYSSDSTKFSDCITYLSTDDCNPNAFQYDAGYIEVGNMGTYFGRAVIGFNISSSYTNISSVTLYMKTIINYYPSFSLSVVNYTGNYPITTTVGDWNSFGTVLATGTIGGAASTWYSISLPTTCLTPGSWVYFGLKASTEACTSGNPSTPSNYIEIGGYARSSPSPYLTIVYNSGTTTTTKKIKPHIIQMGRTP